MQEFYNNDLFNLYKDHYCAYCEEVTKMTKAELSLFILWCYDNKPFKIASRLHNSTTGHLIFEQDMKGAQHE